MSTARLNEEDAKLSTQQQLTLAQLIDKANKYFSENDFEKSHDFYFDALNQQLNTNDNSVEAKVNINMLRLRLAESLSELSKITKQRGDLGLTTEHIVNAIVELNELDNNYKNMTLQLQLETEFLQVFKSAIKRHIETNNFAAATHLSNYALESLDFARYSDESEEAIQKGILPAISKAYKHIAAAKQWSEANTMSRVGIRGRPATLAPTEPIMPDEDKPTFSPPKK